MKLSVGFGWRSEPAMDRSDFGTVESPISPTSPVAEAANQRGAGGGHGGYGGFDPVEQATLFLTLLSAEYDEQLIELRAFARGGQGAVVRRWFPRRGIPDLARTCVGLANRFDVYVGVQPRGRPQGDRSAVASVACLYADLDCGIGKSYANAKAVQVRLTSFSLVGLCPTMIVASGGGYHAYWMFKEMISISEWSQIHSVLRGLTNSLRGDPAVLDLPRILRVPGTLNHKNARPRQVELVAAHEQRAFTLDDFDWLASTCESPLPAFADSRLLSSDARDIADALRILGWSFTAKRISSERVVAFIVEQPCPFCPGPPTQLEPPRRGTLHIATPSGRARCKRAQCRAGAITTGVLATGEAIGIPFSAWAPIARQETRTSSVASRIGAAPGRLRRFPNRR